MYRSVGILVHGLGYTAPERRPDQIRDATPCVSCHDDGTFSYWCDRAVAWIPNQPTIPQRVLDVLPVDERNRVLRRMTAANVLPS
jgi:hypothetical protein